MIKLTNSAQISSNNSHILKNNQEANTFNNILSFQGNINTHCELYEKLKENPLNLFFTPKNKSAQIAFSGQDVHRKTVLVTGGAGYIGSHVSRHLLEKGYDVVAIGHSSIEKDKTVEELKKIAKENKSSFKFYSADLNDKQSLEKVFQENRIDAVSHFAASSQVCESWGNPLRTYKNNLSGTISLLETMKNSGVDKMVFASSALVYGRPATVPITENTPTHPTVAYGTSKLMGEQILKDCENYGLKSVSLRYFNIAGASSDAKMGEVSGSEVRLIPELLGIAKNKTGVRNADIGYPTIDGAPVKDYVHVEDAAAANEKALQRLFSGGGSGTYNISAGQEYSELEIKQICEEVSESDIPAHKEDRGGGDIPYLIADNSKAQRELGWKPEKTMKDIVESQWKWMQKN